jgi:hypothetical protein
MGKLLGLRTMSHGNFHGHGYAIDLELGEGGIGKKRLYHVPTFGICLEEHKKRAFKRRIISNLFERYLANTIRSRHAECLMRWNS